jgi:hypothetical protein
VQSPRSEGWEGVKDVTWGERVEGSEEQKRRADHVQPRAKDLAGEVLRAVHATSRGCSINRSCPRDRVGASERQLPVVPRYRRDRDQDGRTERQP